MKPQYFNELEQGTPEWLEVRRGILTASNTKQLLTPTHKIAKNDKVRELAFELAAQRITGRVEPMVTTYHMERGHIEEVFAREIYEEKYHTVKECGFIRNGNFGYSPDGLVGDDGIIEIKSRIQKHQVKTILSGSTPDEYMIQCQDGLNVSERKWIDFIQYSNGMEMFVHRIERDEELIGLIREVKDAFEKQVAELVEEYKEKSKKYHKAEFIEHVEFGEIEC